MKGILMLTLLVCLSTKLEAQKLIKVQLVFNGIENKGGDWQLCFADKKNVPYYFNTKRSVTKPYVFYSTAVDGSLKENEKIKGVWFVISYTVSGLGRNHEKIITRIEK